MLAELFNVVRQAIVIAIFQGWPVISGRDAPLPKPALLGRGQGCEEYGEWTPHMPVLGNKIIFSPPTSRHTKQLLH